MIKIIEKALNDQNLTWGQLEITLDGKDSRNLKRELKPKIERIISVLNALNLKIKIIDNESQA